MFCTRCGNPLDPDARFCTRCGSPQTAGAIPRPEAVYVPRGGIRSDTGRWIGIGWNVVQKDLGTMVLAAVLFLILNSAVPFVLTGPLAAGFQILCLNGILGRRPEVGDLFKGFNLFVPTLLAGLLVSVFVCVGFVLFLIPGIVVAAVYLFPYLFIVDKRLDFWPAMQASHAVVKQDYFGFSMFVVALGLLNLLGLLLLGVGLLVTVPISMAATAAAYQDVVGADIANPELL